MAEAQITANLEEDACKSIKVGDTKALSRVLDKGLDVNHMFTCCSEGSYRGKMLIQVAVSRKNLGEKRNPLVKLLLERKCDVNKCANLVKEGLKLGLRLLTLSDAQDRLRFSCAYYAITMKDAELTQILVDGGADVNLYDEIGQSGLYYAVETKDEDVVKAVLSSEGCDVNLSDKDKMSPLHQAAVNDDVPIMELLLEKNAKVDIEQVAGSSPLCVSCAKGGFDTAKVLLQHGADPNQNGHSSITPMFAALHRSEDTRIVTMLVKAGGIPRSQDLVVRFSTVLHLLIEDREFSDFFQSRMGSARSLKILTAVAIKDKLRQKSQGTSIKRKLLGLPLPKQLISYLLLEDI